VLKSCVLGAASLAAAAWWSEPVAAQQVAQAVSGLEEIVVTARRKEESAQTVPITVTAFSEQALQQQDIKNSFDMVRMVPGLQVAGGGSNNVGAYSWLRGATGVQGYFNQIPLWNNATNNGLNSPWTFFDLGSAQVLKGPQGTLFGLSVDAGAVVYEPKHPTNQFEGYVQGTLGDYNRKTLEGVINIPVIEDKLLVRLGAQMNKRDGYIHAINRDIDLNSDNYETYRATVLFKPTDTISNETLVNYAYSHNTVGAFVIEAVNPGVPAAFPLPLGSLFSPINGILAQQQQLGWYDIAGVDIQNDRRWVRNWVVNNISTWEAADEFTLKNIFGYSQTTQLGQDSTDGILLPIVGGATPLLSTSGGPSYQWTEEVQAQGKLFDRLSYTGGFFYRKTGNRAPFGITYANSFGSVAGSAGNQKSETKAVYAQGTYDLGDYVEGLSITAGYRYTWDKASVLSQGYSSLGVPGNSSFQKASFSSGSYSLQLQYQVTPQTMLYVNNSKGYKTGGFNGTNLAGSLQRYAPEHLNNIEAGIKTDFEYSGVKGRLNLAGYYGFYNDIQVQVTGVYPRPAGGTGLATPFLNVGDGKIKGIDGEFTVIPLDWLETGINFAYSKGSYDSFLGPNANGSALVNTPGVKYAYTPKWKYNAHATVHLPMPETMGEVSLTANYSWTDKRVNIYRPITSIWDYDQPIEQLDMSLDWKDVLGREGLSGRVWVTNLTQNTLGTGSFAVYSILGMYGRQVAAPRMWGVTVRQEF
jgi:iron complex outermembrane receptor protein